MMIIILQQFLVYKLAPPHVFLCNPQIAFHSTDKSTMIILITFIIISTLQLRKTVTCKDHKSKWWS